MPETADGTSSRDPVGRAAIGVVLLLIVRAVVAAWLRSLAGLRMILWTGAPQRMPSGSRGRMPE